MTEQTTAQPSAEIALPSEAAPPSLRQQVVRMEHQFAMAAPRGVEAAQIVRDVLTAISKNPRLAECVPESVLGGAMTMAQLGLRIGVDGLGHGWLIPFYNSRYEWTDTQGRKRKGANVAQLVIGYQGLVELAHRTDKIRSLSARTRHENDHFVLEYGIDEKLEHRPAAGDRGKPIGYYAVVRFTNGGHSFFYMSQEEMEAYRDRYAMAKTKDGTVIGPWKDTFEKMAHKTCVRQLSKFMPKSTELAIALAADDTVRVDLSPTADIEHVVAHIEPGEVVHTPTATDDIPVEDPPAGGDA